MGILSYLAATLAAISPLKIVLLFIPTWIIALLAGMGLFWRSRVQRKHVSPETVILLCSPRSIIITTAILLCCNAVLLLGPFTGKNATFALGLVFAAFILACEEGLAKFLVVFIADDTGLTRSILFFSKTLPWSTIDWIYTKQIKRSERKPLWTYAAEYRLIVEAGPKQRLKAPLRLRWTRVQADTLRQTIQERATKALVGYDKQKKVQHRRAHTLTHHVRHQ